MTYRPTAPGEIRTLRRAARLWGVQTGFINAMGKYIRTPPNSLLAVLSILAEVEINDKSVLEQVVKLGYASKIKRICDPVIVVDENALLNLRVYLKAAHLKDKLSEDHRLEIQFEDGSHQKSGLINMSVERKFNFEGDEFVRILLETEVTIPIGYHRLKIEFGSEKQESLVLGVPKKRVPSSLDKPWGIFSPLYAMRSKRNWGIGDLADLRQSQEFVKSKGGSFLGTLPILATQNEGEKIDPSPYSPVSRLFWNEIFLNIEEVAQRTQTREPLERYLDLAHVRGKIKKLRAKSDVDYAAVYRLKKEALLILSDKFYESGLDQSEDFKSFVNRSRYLVAYARFCSRGDIRECKFHLFAQFQLDQTLKDLSLLAEKDVIAGLYLDFPVGVSRSGFDSEQFQSSFLCSLSAGAPPDTMFSGGQNWGFAPLHPVKIRESGYEYFILSLRHHMQYAKILRIDHVMAFHRIYIIPKGLDPKSGAYLRYHTREFFGVAMIEAYRSGVQIIGEDLGTVPVEVRSSLKKSGAMGMWVLPFEAGRHPLEALKKARPEVLACMNTHDMIPFEGFIKGMDIDFFEKLGLFTKIQAKNERAEREKLISFWTKDLKTDQKNLFRELAKVMAESSLKYFLINIEDLWRESLPQNIPGTWQEYPNWRKKLKIEIEKWPKRPEMTRVLNEISKHRSKTSQVFKRSELTWIDKSI